MKTALATHSFPEDRMIGSNISSINQSPSLGVPGSEPEELMTLNYSRNVPLLLGAVQKLTERLAQLENHP